MFWREQERRFNGTKQPATAVPLRLIAEPHRRGLAASGMY